MLIKFVKVFVGIIFITGLLISCATESITKSEKLPTIKGYVNDYYKLLTKEQNDNLTSILHDIFLKTKTQIAILIVNSTNEISIENYALKVINSMKIEKTTMAAEILFVYVNSDSIHLTVT